MVDEKKTKKASWLSDLDLDAVVASSEVEILPNFSIDENDNGIEFAKVIVIESMPEWKDFKSEKAKTKGAYIMLVNFNNTQCQMIVPKSLRHHLAVIGQKHFDAPDADLSDCVIRVWREIGKTDFGLKSMYKAELVKSA